MEGNNPLKSEVRNLENAEALKFSGFFVSSVVKRDAAGIKIIEKYRIGLIRTELINFFHKFQDVFSASVAQVGIIVGKDNKMDKTRGITL